MSDQISSEEWEERQKVFKSQEFQKLVTERVKKGYPSVCVEPLEEYCFICGSPMWFLKPGNIRSIIPVDEMCVCEWHCCLSVMGRLHMRHHGLRPRTPGVYTIQGQLLTKFQILRLVADERTALTLTCPVLLTIAGYDIVNMPEGSIEIRFKEENVTSYASDSCTGEFIPGTLESTLQSEMDRKEIEEVLAGYRRLIISSRMLYDKVLELVSDGQVNTKSGPGHWVMVAMHQLNECLNSPPNNV